MILGTCHSIIGFFSLLALAAPKSLPAKRDILWITAPSQGYAWDVGANEAVIWSIDNAQAPDIDLCTPSLYIVDQEGLLDYVMVPGGFKLSAGHVLVQVPSLYSGQYRLQLTCGKYSAMSQFFTLYQS